MKVAYKLMESSHIEGVFELSKLCFRTPWSLDSISYELNNKHAHYIIAEDLSTGKVIGFIGVWIIVGEGNITNIAVHPDYRKCGIASQLLNQLFILCKKVDCTDITLEVRVSNIAAQNLYLKHGFKNEGIRKKYYEDTGEDAIIMWKH